MTQTYKTGHASFGKGNKPADVCLDYYELNKEKVEMVSAISYFLPALCLRINSSLSMGMARFQISSHDIFPCFSGIFTKIHDMVSSLVLVWNIKGIIKT